MIVHNLLIKLRDSSDADIAAARRELLGMEGKIEGLRGLFVAADLRRAETSYDLALLAKFDSMADYQVYLTHPEHLAVGRGLAPRIAATASVCYQE